MRTFSVSRDDWSTTLLLWCHLSCHCLRHLNTFSLSWGTIQDSSRCCSMINPIPKRDSRPPTCSWRQRPEILSLFWCWLGFSSSPPFYFRIRHLPWLWSCLVELEEATDCHTIKCWIWIRCSHTRCKGFTLAPQTPQWTFTVFWPNHHTNPTFLRQSRRYCFIKRFNFSYVHQTYWYPFSLCLWNCQQQHSFDFLLSYRRDDRRHLNQSTHSFQVCKISLVIRYSLILHYATLEGECWSTTSFLPSSPSLLLFGWYHWYVDFRTTSPQLFTIHNWGVRPHSFSIHILYLQYLSRVIGTSYQYSYSLYITEARVIARLESFPANNIASSIVLCLPLLARTVRFEPEFLRCYTYLFSDATQRPT